jgi:hypothetical protein
MTHEVVYIGGLRHGEREARPGDPFEAPDTLTFPTCRLVRGEPKRGRVTYRLNASADTPGALAYVFEYELAFDEGRDS